MLCKLLLCMFESLSVCVCASACSYVCVYVCARVWFVLVCLGMCVLVHMCAFLYVGLFEFPYFCMSVGVFL